jgi:nucleoside-diphosphate-sugar epimerase
MKCIVTGAAGFIGSHLCEELLRLGHEVTGLDAFVPYYPQVIKQRNVLELLCHTRCRFYRVDLRSDPLDKLMTGTEVVFHLAAMPGLPQSWSDFDDWTTCNLLATQKLLEALRPHAGRLQRLIFASASAVYGEFACGDETLPTRPISPHGISKLAAEHLCRACAESFGLPLVTLRYFSVYGPRQRPDMGLFRFMQSLLSDQPVVVYGDGEQFRGHTYVDDCVQANIAALQARVGEVYNVGGHEKATVWEVLRKLENLTGRQVRVRQEPARPGDQRQSLADTTKLRNHVGWEPRISLDEGLARQWQWQRQVASPARSIG